MSAATPPELQGVVEELVRKYVGRTLRRYAPFVAGALALTLLIALTPSVSPNLHDSGTGYTGGNVAAGGAPGVPGTSASGNGTGSAAPLGANGGPATDTGSGAGPAALATGGVGGANSGASGSASYSGAVAGGGTATVNVNCATRQVPWSKNGPCLTAFSGSNGGATSPGVSANTIVASFRTATSGESAAIEAAAGGDNQVQSAVQADMAVYVNYFNTQFQLYGRKVVFKPFNGQGDWLREFQGQDLQGAQADAATAKGENAFIDLSPAATSSSPPYCADLAQEHVICAGGVAEVNSYMQRYYPYALTPVATFDYLGNYWAAIACQRMAQLPAIFAGDPIFQRSNRKFGIVAMDEPDYKTVTDLMVQRMNACGATVVKNIAYPFDVNQLEQQDVNIIAQLKAAGVTTVICLCDTLSPTLLTHAGVQQSYYPEWLGINDGDGYGQQRQTSEWSHAMLTVGTQIPGSQSEAYKVYQRASPGRKPAEAAYWLQYTYYAALAAFSAIQAAGPNLTPTTFMNGLFSLPPSLPGATADGIPWHPGKGVFAFLDEAPIGWWNPSAPSPDNGQNGTTISCAGGDGDWHPIQTYQPEAYGPRRTQLKCFGKT